MSLPLLAAALPAKPRVKILQGDGVKLQNQYMPEKPDSEPYVTVSDRDLI